MGIHLVFNMRYMCSTWFKKNSSHENVTLDIALQIPGYHKWHLRQVAQTSAKPTPGQSNPGETKSMEATTPELGPVAFWSPKSSSFSGSESIVVEKAARNFLSPQPSVNKSREANSIIYHNKVEASKLRRYLETCGRTLEQFLQRPTSSDNSIIFLLHMVLDWLVRSRASVREYVQ